MANVRTLSAWVYAGATALVVAFQIALAAGAPWGEYAMGGASPGKFPPALRVSAIVQAALLALLAVSVLSRAGIVLPAWSRAARWLVWLAVVVSTLSLVLNLITPSSGERLLWVPVLIVLLVTSVLVATGPRA